MNKYKNLAFNTIILAVGTFGSKDTVIFPHKTLYYLHAVGNAWYKGAY